MRRPAARLKQPPIEDDRDYDPGPWELRYRSKRTGDENRVIFFCRGCGYREKPIEWPLQHTGDENRTCPACREFKMRFVAYRDGVEDREAMDIINGIG